MFSLNIKEKVLDLYFIDHKKQKEIAKTRRKSGKTKYI